MNTFERIDPLGRSMSIVVSDRHIFSTDAVILADFANPKSRERLCDLGTGCGIIPLLWCKRQTGPITAVEIQPQACRQVEKSLQINGLEGRVEVINADLRRLDKILPAASFDLVSMNPPYKQVGGGIESASDADKIARHETMCTIDDAVAAAARLLRFSGRFCMCVRPERLSDAVCAMRAHKLELKKLRFVSHRAGKQPFLVLLEGKRGAKSGVFVMPELLLEDENGAHSSEYNRIFADYSNK